MATTPPGIPTDIAAIAGPLYLAYLFQWGLFGALSVQLYNYHLAFPRDRPALKALVYAVYLLELVQTLIVARDGFATYAAGFGNMDALNDIQTVWFSGPLLIGIVSCVVQLYYGYRVFILSKSKVLFGVIGALSLLQFSAAIAQAVISKRIGNLHDLATDSPVPSGVWLAGTAVCDLVITGSMVYLLLFHTKSSNRLLATHTIIARIVLLTIETGVLTATAASLDLILLYSFPKQSYHAGVTFTLGKLYSNSLLVLLNNRAHLQRGGVHTLSLRMSALDSSARSGSGSNTSAAVAVGGIRVEQMTFVTADSGDVDERSVEKPTRLSEVEA